MDIELDGELRRNSYLIDAQREQLKKLDDQIVSRKRELQTLDEALVSLLSPRSNGDFHD